jgi:rSAM/selenodomain-associated transferase 2/rSAM/selenodomain-associated transferase 1
MHKGYSVAVIIPALNEAAAIGQVLEAMPSVVDRVIVADNGSTDATASEAREHGAAVVHEPRRGYGAACLAGLAAAGEPDIVVFLDADHSDDPSEMLRLLAPLTNGDADLVIGSRAMGRADRGALRLPQRFGNALASFLLSRLWQQPCTDLGPFRAIRFDALRALEMNDLGYGWTVQMQARAMRLGLHVHEVPISYRRRIGRSKISGTVRGVIGAGTKILTTIGREALAPTIKPFRRHRLIVFTRFPEPGTTKTRLIPALGAEGAATLQRQMIHQTLQTARAWQRAWPGRQVEVRFTGGTADDMAKAFGCDLTYVQQGEGTLGQRLERAVNSALHGAWRADAAAAIGTDCPDLDKATLNNAFATLQNEDIVLGPADDGGYYLIGLHDPIPELFHDIEWGSAKVFNQTRAAADCLGLRVGQLDTLSDVDEPKDLDAAQATIGAADTSRPSLSVVIPALNEETDLPAALQSIGCSRQTEIIVVDGGSTDATFEVARAHGATVVQSEPGRATQLNEGARAAHGKVLLFLHADTRLPFGYRQAIETSLNQPDTIAGAFPLAFDDSRFSLRLIEAGANLRSRTRQLPYGEQALFMKRHIFNELGGFRELPVMEDYDLVRRLREHGQIALGKTHVITSARCWLRQGIWRTTFNHQRLLLAWHLGDSSQCLKQMRETVG